MHRFLRARISRLGNLARYNTADGAELRSHRRAASRRERWNTMHDEPTTNREQPSRRALDDRGVFGNLPSARPGMRSPRRGDGRVEEAEAGGAKSTKPCAGGRQGRKPAPKAPPPPRRPQLATSPPSRSPRRRPSGGERGGVEELAWAGIAVAAEAATLGVRLAEPRRSEAVRERNADDAGGSAAANEPSRDRVGTQHPQLGRRSLRAFWQRAYERTSPGWPAMVAYNLVLALFPFALLVLFIFGQVLQSPDVEASVLNDLQRLFPAVEPNTLDNALDHIRDSSTTIGVAAAIGAHLDRHLVLGGDGHRLLPHLPRRVPRLARAEALRAGDAARGHPLPRRERRRPGPGGRPRRRAPATCRSASTRSAGSPASCSWSRP